MKGIGFIKINEYQIITPLRKKLTPALQVKIGAVRGGI